MRPAVAVARLAGRVPEDAADEVEIDDSFDESKPVYHVSEGVCGFASLVVRPANSSFAHWLKANVRTNKHYGGGLAVSSSSIVPEDIRSQSYERKVAAIRAVANVLREAGIKASCWDRLD